MAESPTPRPRRTVVAVIEAYRRWSADRPPSCRYVPTCSAYAREAVEVHGSVRGGVLALRRVLRCHPLATDGFAHDPVPALRER